MSPVREMVGATIALTPDQERQEVAVTFRIPGSKFGSVRVILTFAEAQALATDLLEASE